MNKKTHSFTLVVSGVDRLVDQFAESLYSICNDATLGESCGVLTVDFDRRAPSFRDAVVSAMDDVERAIPQARVVRIEPDPEPRRRQTVATSKKR